MVWLDPLQCFGMARYAEVSASLKDWETFVSGRGVGMTDFTKEEPWRPPSLLLETDPPAHNRTRGLMNKVATLASLKSAMPDWIAKAESLMDRLAGRTIDAVTDLAEAFPLSVFPDLIGIRKEGREHLIPYGTTAFNGFGPRNRLFEEAMANAAAATVAVMESCRRENLVSGGWGSKVYEAADRGDCTADEAGRLVRSFLTAGLDTTVNGIGNMICAFAQHPEQWAKLRADPGLAKKAFEESLRWEGTVQTFFRTTSREAPVEGGTISEGSKVILFLAAANRDPRHWEHAAQFDITRSASGHVGFGFGIHQCLGQMVARMESEALLKALIPRVREIRLAGEPVRRLNNTLHALASLPVDLVAG